MRTGTPGFFPERLRQARAVRRFNSMSDLARSLDVNPSTVARWEEGSISPDASMLSKLSAVLQVRPEYFLRPVPNTRGPIFFRSLSSALHRDIAYQRVLLSWLQDVSVAIEHYVDFPQLDIPDVLAGATYRNLRDDDIEEIALSLRTHWQLGIGPCPDVVGLLERIGVIVCSVHMNTSKLDGLCGWNEASGRPHILLALDKMSFFRRQMDAAHELAHLVLHRNVSSEQMEADIDLIEEQAFRLASAFLMPSTSYPHEVARPSLAALLTLKGRWRVSIKAQIKRLRDLDILSMEQSTSLYKLYSAKGWNKGEPLDKETSIPNPRLLKDALQLIVDGGVRTKADLLALEFTIQSDDVEKLIGLERNWFSARSAEIVTLRRRDDGLKSQRAEGAEVVPFRKGR